VIAFSLIQRRSYIALCRLIAEFPSLRIDGAVYMRARPGTCLSRLRDRGREEESTIAIEYLEQLNTRHEEWLLPSVYQGQPLPDEQVPEKSLSLDGVPVLVLDCNSDFSPGSAKQAEMLSAIDKFVTGLD
jgi:hypothetical protein